MINKEYFESICTFAFQNLTESETLSLSLNAEDTQFIRFNKGKIRQIGHIDQIILTFTYYFKENQGTKKANLSLALTGQLSQDEISITTQLEILKKITHDSPIDPFCDLPQAHASSEKIHTGSLLEEIKAPSTIGSLIQKLPLTGIYASGKMIRANSNHLPGTPPAIHYFETDLFSFDYSLFNENNTMVKGGYSGSVWETDVFQKTIESNQFFLEKCKLPLKRIPKGRHRTYLGPQAVAELMGILNYNFIGEKNVRTGLSPLKKVLTGEKKFSPLLTLTDDFSLGLTPQFNSLGEFCENKIPVIEKGQFVQNLVSTRSAQEYKIESNRANSRESFRSPVIATGNLKEEDVLKKIGTGFYLSNLHYLNWSDLQSGRFTGMTRYACFWVEEGVIQGPIENLRFDENIFHVFGSGLEDLTQNSYISPEVSTYRERMPEGVKVPGILLESMNFTL